MDVIMLVKLIITLSKRINDHLTNNGSLWTKLHKVIGEEKIILNCSSFDEDRYVKEYMSIKDCDLKINEYNDNILKYNKKQKGGTIKKIIDNNEILYMLLPFNKYLI